MEHVEPGRAAAGRGFLAKELRDRFGPDVTEGSAVDQELELSGILQWLKPRTVLEIGTRHGISAALYARHAQRVITVDIEKSPRSYREWASQIWEATGTKDRIEAYLAPGEVGWQYNAAKRSFLARQEFDFAFIDGSHDWRDVWSDFRSVRRCGCVLFHDYKPEGGLYADCTNERFQGIADVIDSLTPRAYLLGKRCSRMALWLAPGHPALADRDAAAWLAGLLRPERSVWSARCALLGRYVDRRAARLRASVRRRFGGAPHGGVR